MSVDDLAVRLGLPLVTFAYSIASGFIPVLNAEVFLVGVAAVVPASQVTLLAGLAALGQMVAKSGMYLVGAGVLSLRVGDVHAKLEAARTRAERWRSRDLLVLVSAFVGLPPFFVVSILAGTLRFPFARFLVAGLAGRFLRFALVMAVPQVARWFVGGAP